GCLTAFLTHGDRFDPFLQSGDVASVVCELVRKGCPFNEVSRHGLSDVMKVVVGAAERVGDLSPRLNIVGFRFACLAPSGINSDHLSAARLKSRDFGLN